MWLTEPSSKDTRRTSSPIMEIINAANQWDDKDSIINKDEFEFRRVSLFDVRMVLFKTHAFVSPT